MVNVVVVVDFVIVVYALPVFLCSAPRGSPRYTEINFPAFSEQQTYTEIPQHTSCQSYVYKEIRFNHQQSSGPADTMISTCKITQCTMNIGRKQTLLGTHLRPWPSSEEKTAAESGKSSLWHQLQLSAVNEKQRHSKSAESPLYESSVKDTAADLQPNSLYNQNIGIFEL